MQEKKLMEVNINPQIKLKGSKMQAVLQISQPQQKVQSPQKIKQRQIQKADLQFSLNQQKKNMENIKTATELFNKKYFGNKNDSAGKQKKQLVSNPSLNLVKKDKIIKKAESQCLLPQMKQIQMIFRTQNRKDQKKKIKKDLQKDIIFQNGYYSSFQLYSTKKNMMKQNATLTELKIQKNILKQRQRIKINQENNQQNIQQTAKQFDSHNHLQNVKQSDSHKNLPKKPQKLILKPIEKQSTPTKIIKSERQLLNIFQQTIIKEKYQKPIFSLRQFLDQEKQKNFTQNSDNFQQDINQLTKVAKQMIFQFKVKSKILGNGSRQQTPILKEQQQVVQKANRIEQKNIIWVIKECDKLNKKKFSVRKTKSSVRKTKSVSQMKKK